MMTPCGAIAFGEYKRNRSGEFYGEVESGGLYYDDSSTFGCRNSLLSIWSSLSISWYLYYKNEFGKLVGIQATLSKYHAQTVSTCKRLYDKTGTNSENTPLELYYLLITRLIDHHCHSSFPKSHIRKSVRSGIGSRWKNINAFNACSTW